MANPNPTLFERVCEVLLFIFVVFPYLGYYVVKQYIKEKTNPKFKHLNWLRKLAGIPPK